MNCEMKSDVLPQWDASAMNACPVDFCMKLMDTARSESCGECVLCREGTFQAYEIIKDITKGNSTSDDYELLLDVLGQIKEYASCEMSKTAAKTAIDLMKDYEDEWNKHLLRKVCTTMVCKGMFSMYIDPAVCTGCGACKSECPNNAIIGSDGFIHIIDPTVCNKSLVCVDVCPVSAIKKAGKIRPKLPTELIAVGSFGVDVGGDEDSGRRRRRRRE